MRLSVFFVSLVFMGLCCALPGMAADLAISPEVFRQRYNMEAEKLKAPLMPGQRSESVAVPDKSDNAHVFSTVDIYFLNERTSLLLNRLTARPDVIAAAAVMGGTQEDYILPSVTDMQSAMIALIATLTPGMSEPDRTALLRDLGILGGENGDFTDGRVRTQTAGGLVLYTAASGETGIELVIRPAESN